MNEATNAARPTVTKQLKEPTVSELKRVTVGLKDSIRILREQNGLTRWRAFRLVVLGGMRLRVSIDSVR